MTTAAARSGRGRTGRVMLAGVLACYLAGCAGRDMSWNEQSGAFSLPLEANDPSKDKETKRDAAQTYPSAREPGTY